MTRQIENTIKGLMFLCECGEIGLTNKEKQHVKLAIRSLKAWEKVLQELEEMICEYDCTINEFQRGANAGANFIRNKAIEIINQKLAEIKE